VRPCNFFSSFILFRSILFFMLKSIRYSAKGATVCTIIFERCWVVTRGTSFQVRVYNLIPVLINWTALGAQLASLLQSSEPSGIRRCQQRFQNSKWFLWGGAVVYHYISWVLGHISGSCNLVSLLRSLLRMPITTRRRHFVVFSIEASRDSSSWHVNT